MNLNEFKEEVHRNAIEHGWWGPEYTDATVIALIHAEISEAFEEWRAGRPAKWYKCMIDGEQCNGPESCAYKQYCANSDDFVARMSPKPEGIAVELIDVVLRILDTAAAWHVEIGPLTIGIQTIREMDLPTLAAVLHFETSHLLDPRFQIRNSNAFGRMTASISFIATWLEAQGVDAAAILREKHAYNVKRPFKHGGKKC